MAKGLKTGGRNFTPGNPYSGRPKLPEDLKIVKRELTLEILKAKIQSFLLKTNEQLQEILIDPSTVAIDKMLVSIIDKAINLADHQRLDFVLTRLLGKEPEKIIQLNLHQHYNSDLEEIPMEVLRELAAKKDVRDDRELESDIVDDSGRDD